MAAKKSPPKKTAKKSPPKKMPAKKAPPKACKPAAKVAVPVKKGAPPKKVAPPKKALVGGPPKPKAAAAPKVSAPKPKAVEKDTTRHYCNLRKWTTVKMEPLLAADNINPIRQRIRSTHKGPLLATELLEYLTALEADKLDWKEIARPKGTKRGRPRKEDAAKKTAPLPKAVAPAAAHDVIAKAKSGSLLMRPTFAAPAAAATAPAPNGLRFKFKLPAQA